MVTEVPGAAVRGVTSEIVAVLTVNAMELDQSAPCCTRATPDLEPGATVAIICVSLQFTTLPGVLPSHTAAEPRVLPKPEPTIVIVAFAPPDAGDTLVRAGGTVTVKGVLLLAAPLTIIATFPVVAPWGTATVMLLALQTHVVPALVPLKVTDLLPWPTPKLAPVIMMVVPTGPEAG